MDTSPLQTLGLDARSGLDSLLDRLLGLRETARAQAAERLSRFAGDFPDGHFSLSAINLAQYLAVRRQDLRDLQDRLAALGLSSLGRGESHILDNLNRVIGLLAHSAGVAVQTLPPTPDAIDAATGRRLLEDHCEQVFGPAPVGRAVRLMVTLPGSAADDALLVHALVAEGMNCARINCAHDDRNAWARMIEHVRSAENASGRECRVLMDLAGQKIRTGPVETQATVFRLNPERDRLGNIVRPAWVLLHVDGSSVQRPAEVRSHQALLRIPAKVHAELAANDRIVFNDLRGKRRLLEVTERTPQGDVIAQCWQSAYFTDAAEFVWQSPGHAGQYHKRADFKLEPCAEVPVEIKVDRGDPLLLTFDGRLGQPARYDVQGHSLTPAHIGCSHPDIIGTLKPGQQVWIDDGRIGALVETVSAQDILLRITHAGSRGAAVRPDKGLNFPGLSLDLPALTDKDREDLDFIVAHADGVNFSFVQTAADLRALMDELDRRGAGDFPIVAKIETQQAVTHLPAILLCGIGRHPLGIMIARGDLAIEIGNARLAEIQEEILWLCEAAHVPVVWATQVLETMAKKGIRSRPELTDAAMSGRAECVMLNKGPYILDAIRVLNSILTRMEAHQRKKDTRLRALHW